MKEGKIVNLGGVKETSNRRGKENKMTSKLKDCFKGGCGGKFHNLIVNGSLKIKLKNKKKYSML